MLAVAVGHLEALQRREELLSLAFGVAGRRLADAEHETRDEAA